MLPSGVHPRPEIGTSPFHLSVIASARRARGNLSEFRQQMWNCGLVGALLAAPSFALPGIADTSTLLDILPRSLRRLGNRSAFQSVGCFHARVGETCLRFCRIEKPKAGKIAS